MFPVNGGQLVDSLPKLGCFRCGETAFIKTSSSKNIHLAVQGVRLVVVGFERVQACKCVFDFGILNLPQTREQRLFFVCGVLGGRFPKVSESGFECLLRLFGQGEFNDLGDAL